ncbi:MAG TPA: TerC family protein [Dehalococcoidia bacterium]|nr:TerC family protein [Dehalococcoidia bacterium]
MDNGVDVSIWFWVAFNAGVLALLAADLGLFHRKAHAPTVREAALWSATWVALSMLFAAGIFVFDDANSGVAFLTGYVIEYSLSVDNIFVFVLIFTYFSVPAAYQHRVLFWGIIGALVLRGALIGVGSVLLHEFGWVVYLFGAGLILSAVKMITQDKSKADIERNLAVRLFRRVMPLSNEYDGQRFLVRRNGLLMATPLLLVLVVTETTDLIFAVDSIPAIFAVTDDPFLVYTSNVCAILGLRSLYFLLAGVVDKFHYLTLGLGIILAWVGAKMLLTDVYHVPIYLSLGVIGGILTASIVASMLRPGAGHALDAPSQGEAAT